jgi:Tfp pilus assembly protein PilF
VEDFRCLRIIISTISTFEGQNWNLEPQTVHKKRRNKNPQGEIVSEGEAALLKEGIALRKDGNFKEALAKFDEVLNLNPKSAAAYREMAIALHMMDEKSLAMDAYKTALKMIPHLE